jgi:hypothetical protein
MKRILTTLSLLATFVYGTAHADCCNQDYRFYLKVGSGVSFSQNANVNAPASTWTPAIQGYNANLGNCGIADLGVGCEVMRCIDLDVSVSARSSFEYRKFQTPFDGDDSYTREFNLDVIPIFLSVKFLGRDFSCLNWNIGCGQVYPIVGVGIGVSNLLISNFRTTGLPPSGASGPFDSFASENQYTVRRNFSYSALIGFEYNYQDSWALSTGYRWFDAGQFSGPRYIRVDTGGAVDVANQTWKMNFHAHEWFLEFKLYL